MTIDSQIFADVDYEQDGKQAGQPIGQIHSIEQAHQPPWSVFARTSGMLISRRAFPLTRQGDCVATLVRRFDLY